MRILILGLNFHPEPTGIGKYTGEMADFLARHGHQVQVVTAPPYYPHWRVQAGYRSWMYRRENRAAMTIYRCPLWVPRRPTGLRRLLHLLSFSISSFPVLLTQAFRRPDLVLCVAPAFFCAPYAWLTARLCGAKAWLHIQDFELDAATRLGLIASGPLNRWAAMLEGWILRRFDKVSTLSERMRARLLEKGVPPERTCLFPNWVDPQVIFPLTEPPASLRASFGLPPEKTIVLYSGSMGNKQGLDLFPEIVHTLEDRADLFFVLCGEGSAREGLEQSLRGASNVRFLPLQPAEVFNRLLNAADIHILPQRAGAADLVMPSKLPGMLSSGRAVIAAAAPGTEIAGVLAGAGLVVPPEDAAALCAAIRKLADSPGERTALGEAGRRLVMENWSAERVLEHFHQDIQWLVRKPAPPVRPGVHIEP